MKLKMTLCQSVVTVMRRYVKYFQKCQKCFLNLEKKASKENKHRKRSRTGKDMRKCNKDTPKHRAASVKENTR